MGIMAAARSRRYPKPEQVAITEFYNYPWNYVLRPSKWNAELAEYMIEACANNNILYSQQKRGYMSEYSSPAQIANTYYVDCSSLVIGCIRMIGRNMGDATWAGYSATWTGNMAEAFSGIGDIFPYTSESALNIGDILLNTINHTAVYITHNDTPEDPGDPVGPSQPLPDPGGSKGEGGIPAWLLLSFNHLGKDPFIYE